MSDLGFTNPSGKFEAVVIFECQSCEQLFNGENYKHLSSEKRKIEFDNYLNTVLNYNRLQKPFQDIVNNYRDLFSIWLK